MAEDEKSKTLGKKVFFLHPSAITQNHVVYELAQEEFEVYILRDEFKLKQALLRYPDSIVFASINEAVKESAWDELVRGIMGKPETAGVQVGIISSVNDESLKQKYIEKYNVRCGFTVIKSDYNEAVKHLIAILDNVNAKGRRKYIRMVMEKETNATLNVPLNGTFVNGSIKDISVVGFSCVFAEDPGLPKNGLFNDIQLRLQAQLLKVEGIVFGSRMDGSEKVYVILFSQRVDLSEKTKIRKYIQSNLQTRMEQELK